MLRLLAATAAGAALAVGGVVLASESVANEQTACASATASVPERVLSQDGPLLDGQRLPGSSYTIPGAVATDTQCVTVTADTVTNTVTETVPGPTTTVTETVTAPTTTTPTVERRVLWGASTPPNSAHGTTTKEAEARWLEGKIGRKLDVTRHYVKAPNPWTGDGAAASVTSGRVPVISFTSGGDSWSQVANGSLDSYVEGECADLTARGGGWLKAFVGFENEPEAESPGKGSPADYVRAYQHLLNGPLASCPSTVRTTTFLMEYSWQSGSGRNPEAWVPPSVDYLGVHGYSTRVSTCGDGPRSFVDTFDGPHATAVKFGKRMGIWEMGYSTKVGANPEAKADFFRSIPGALTSLPRVDAITYWNQGSGKCADANSYYIDSSPAALDGYADAGRAPIFGG